MDKSTKRKLYLLGGLVVSILIFMGVMYSQIERGEELKIAVVSFETELKGEVKEMIPPVGKKEDFVPKASYQQLLDEIKTEHLLTKIDLNEEKNTLKMVYDAYLEYVVGVSKNILKNGRWSSGIMAALRYNNKLMLANEFCDVDSKKIMQYNVGVVDKYFESIALISSSGSYASVENSESKIEKARLFMSDSSLKPCSDLMNQLGYVRENLYRAHVNYVKGILETAMRIKNRQSVNSAMAQKDNLISSSQVYGKKNAEILNILSNYISNLEAASVKITAKETEKIMKNIDDEIW